MKYDIKKMKQQLSDLGEELASFEKAQISADEKVSTETLKNYFKCDKIPTLALAAAIIKKGEEIIKNREIA